jgi:hypothetical protein
LIHHDFQVEAECSSTSSARDFCLIKEGILPLILSVPLYPCHHVDKVEMNQRRHRTSSSNDGMIRLSRLSPPSSSSYQRRSLSDHSYCEQSLFLAKVSCGYFLPLVSRFKPAISNEESIRYEVAIPPDVNGQRHRIRAE